MPPTRLTAAMLLGIGLALMLSGTVLCQDHPTMLRTVPGGAVPPPARAEAVEKPEAKAPPPKFPLGPRPMPQRSVRRHLQPPSPPGPPVPIPGKARSSLQ